MEQKEHYAEMIRSIKGKTVAIVYIFEGENAPGFRHYHVWKSDVISLWMKAIETLHGMPFILDVRTFVQKALNNTLPKVDYVINLNCGSCELSPMSLVPATCAFIGVPCIPCDAVTIVTGENKRLSNLIAQGVGLNIPQELPFDDTHGIYRPLNLGSSCGVTRGSVPDKDANGLYQEFLPGYDITTPIVYNPLKGDMALFPTIIYLPNSENLNWYFGSEEKSSGKGYRRAIIPSLSEQVKQTYLKLAHTIGIHTYCRIDARVRCADITTAKELQKKPLQLENLYFVEINPMATIKQNNSFGFSFSALAEGDEFYQCVKMFAEITGDKSLHSFLLSSSMLALKPGAKEKRI